MSIRHRWLARLDGLGRRVAELDASLLPKILGAFILVLTLSSLLTLLLENRLTRQELQTQADVLLVSQIRVLDQVSRDRLELLQQNLLSTAEVLQLQQGRSVDDDLAITRALADLRRSFSPGLANAFHESGDLIGFAPGSVAETPPAEAFAAGAEIEGVRVVRTVDGGYALVVATTVGRAPDRVVLVAGDRFDDVGASRLGFNRGSRDTVMLVVDDRVVGSTSRGLEGVPAPASGRAAPSGLHVVDLGGVETFVRYAPVAQADGTGWGHDARLGIAIPEPLISLDRRLLQNRVIMIVVLVGTTAFLAWVTTRLITRPLLRLATTAGSIAAGDLETPFASTSTDEIGVLASALERMRRVLRAQLHVIRRQAMQLQDAARRVVGVQDEERRRLARDLHDGIQQQLVMLRLQVGSARSRLSRDPDALDEVADGLAEEIDRIIERLRETSLDIFPSILQDRGLQGALFSLAGRSRVPIDVRTAPDPLPRFAPDLEANAYFLISEALTNAMKHARAGRIDVSVRLLEDALRVSVTDDGTGFDAGGVSGSGLTHMRDRVNAVGGTLRIRSRPGRGTRVTAVLPLSVRGALEEEQDGGDAPVQVDLLGQPQLPEDRVRVLLDGPFADEEIPGDGGVALP